MIPAEFDEIRPYLPAELPQIFEELIADPEFQTVIGYAIKDIPFEHIAMAMRASKDNLAFQKAIIYPFLQGIVKKLTSEFSLSYENIDNLKKSLCISNHRDIIMDSAFLSILTLAPVSVTVTVTPLLTESGSTASRKRIWIA